MGGSTVNDEFNILRDKSFDMHEEEAVVHLCRLPLSDKIISFHVSPREKNPLSLEIASIDQKFALHSCIREISSMQFL